MYDQEYPSLYPLYQAALVLYCFGGDGEIIVRGPMFRCNLQDDESFQHANTL